MMTGRANDKDDGVGAGKTEKEAEFSVLCFCISNQYHSFKKACICSSQSAGAVLDRD